MCVHAHACIWVFLQSSDDDEGLGKGRGRNIMVNKIEMPGWAETLESFRLARESWDLLQSHDSLGTGTPSKYIPQLPTVCSLNACPV